MEEEFIRNQEQMKPLEEKQEVSICTSNTTLLSVLQVWVKWSYQKNPVVLGILSKLIINLTNLINYDLRIQIHHAVPPE